MSLHAAYAELGLDPSASEGEVKSAWRRLVSQWHPDRNPSAAAVSKMQKVNQAFNTIRSATPADEAPVAREAHREPPSEEPQAAPEPPVGEPEPAAARGGRTVSRKLKLTLEEAAFGCTKLVQGQLTSTCVACEGLGHRVLGGDCSACAGSGRVRPRHWYGLFGAEAECEACAGSGQAREVCVACAGAGKLPPRRYRVSVRIPAGVRDADMLQVDGRRLGPDQPAGGLQLRIEVAPHPLFRLAPDGSVHTEMPVDAFAWLGQRVIEVPTLEGRMHRLPLNREQLSYRLPGMGFPVARRGARGDQFITLAPTFPQRMGSDPQILLEQLVAAAASADDAVAAPRLREWEQQLRVWSRAQRKR